ncbi:MAG: SurA N-terminal domain-containing protein [Deltaproteobacteria bacterium]|nr:SurA N-terminal domain-containing protein [Deltaproteobacteria bacterium]
MLDFLRSRSTGYLAWIILGTIAVVFGLQFGLPGDITLGPDSVAEVHGEEIRNEDFRFQSIMVQRFGLVPKEPKVREMVGVNEEIIDGIVERIVLAHEADRMGLAATKTEAEDIVLDGHVMLFGNRLEWLGPEEKFNYELFKNNWLGPLRVPEPAYLEQQAEETLAQTLRDVVGASVVIPESEIRNQYDSSANTLALRYARYDFAAFADLADPTPAQLDAYVADNAEELDKRYESQKTRFTALPRQARLSIVKAGTSDEARAALTEARAQVIAGAQRMAAVARAQSTHDTAARGGDYGWTDEQSDAASDLPDAVRAVIADLSEADVSQIIEADDALWLVQVTARREGDVPRDDALRELAEEGLRDQLGEDLARRAAEEDQNVVTAGGPLTEVFSQPGALGETTLFGGTAIEAVELPGEGEDDDDDDATAKPDGADPVAGLSRPKAELRSTGPFVKGQRIPGLGLVPQLVDDAWALEGEAELLDGLYEVPGAVVLAGVEAKEQANDEDFAEQRDDIERGLRQAKSRAVFRSWARRRCLDAKGQGDIKVSEGTIKRLTTYDTTPPDGKKEETPPPARPTHTVCDRVGGGGGMLTARLR